MRTRLFLMLPLICAPLAFWACGGDSGTSAKDDESSSSSSSVIPGHDRESSSSVAKSSSSVASDSSSSVIPSSSSDVIPSEVDIESSGSSIPYEFLSSPVEGSSSSVASSSSEVVQLIPYTTESPAGHACTYAPTEQLNPDITYGEFLDTRDYQVYKTVTIGTQTWMAQNLNYADSVKTTSLRGKSWCYGYYPEKCAVTGRLYTWAAAIDSVALASDGYTCGYGAKCDRLTSTVLAANPIQGVCPSGWHLPSYAEWNALRTAAGESSSAGKALKSANGWLYGHGNGTDAFGFSALPAGSSPDGGIFCGAGFRADFWSASQYEDDSNYAYLVNLDYNSEDADLDCIYKDSGSSIRCIKND